MTSPVERTGDAAANPSDGASTRRADLVLAFRSRTTRSLNPEQEIDDALGPCSSHDADSNYLADVLIDPLIEYRQLAEKLRHLVDAVVAVDHDDRPMFVHW